MNNYLLVYDRKRRTLLNIQEYTSNRAEEAFADRLRLERDYLGDSSIEVVVLGAESMEALAKTHSRYFSSFGEQIGRLGRSAAS